jgi:putative flippase GtrA
VILRWVKFNTVGAIGIAVQLAALAAFQGLLGERQYLIATALAVEVAVLHNFVWHLRWTWRQAGDGRVFTRLLRFNFSNGALSLVSNLVLMRVLVGVFHWPVLPANLVCISITALANFAISEWWVFR